jgi:NAD(P)-dependent dehydrogenase (short-subunit alcohol dehydrogenase family)
VVIASDRPLDGQVALVTGGASGIGRATAQVLAAAGAAVAVLDLDEAAANRTVDEVGERGSSGLAIAIDLADPPAIEAAVARVLEVFGRIDVLVNCAGISAAPHSSLDFTDEQFEAVVAINLRAPFLLTRAVGAHMVERGGGGRIVNLSSSAAFRATAAPAIYAATKAGINGLTRSSAADLARHDVLVNAVAPGMTKTPMTASIGDDEAYDRVVSGGPLENLTHRAAEAEDVANVVLFLCLPESRQITAQVIHTSAGLVI